MLQVRVCGYIVIRYRSAGLTYIEKEIEIQNTSTLACWLAWDFYFGHIPSNSQGTSQI